MRETQHLLKHHRSKDGHGGLNSSQGMLAERTPRAWGCVDKRSRGQNRMAELFRQVLHPNNLVDGRPHEGEL